MSQAIKIELRKKKEMIFADLSALHNFFKTAKSQRQETIRAKYQRAQAAASSFDAVIGDILKYNAGVTDPAEEVSLRDRDSFLELIDAIRTYYFRIMEAAESHQVPDRPGVSAPCLPRIQLPAFDGTIERWMEFKTIFDTLVHNNDQLSEEQKFHYLKTNLRGEAASTISSFALNRESYQPAYKMLIKRYHSSRRLGNFYLQSMLKFKSNSGFNAHKFLNVHESAINALKQLEVPDLAEFLLFQLSYNNLDSNNQQAFDLNFNSSDAMPGTDELLKYVRLLAQTDELKKDVTSKNWPCSNPKAHLSEVRGREKFKQNDHKGRCSYCQQDHFLAFCPNFQRKPWQVRKEFVIKAKLCHNCLGQHFVKNCRSQRSCKVCQQKHHSLIHPEPTNVAIEPKEEKLSTHLSHQNKSALLSTATIIIESEDNRQTVRALIDPGSEANFISESLVQRLGLKRQSSSAIVSGVGATTNAVTRGHVQVKFKAHHNPAEHFTIEALILPKLTSYLPPKVKAFPTHEFNQIVLADEDLLSREPIEIILGVEIYAIIVQDGILKVRENTITLQNTKLGWIFCGAFQENSNQALTVHCSMLDRKLLQQLERFWQMEEPKAAINQEDVECEEHFQRTFRRNEEGRFEVRLPFKSEPSKLGESRSAAYRALNYCEKKLAKNQDLSILYHNFLLEYRNLNHMEVIKEIPKNHYFLPHHGVLRPASTTTKLRVVFNASKKTSSGKSLNDILHVGPQLLPEVQDLLLRWRRYKIVFSADIEKMYRQILIHEEDQCFQIIVWKDEVYRLKTVTYGTACAPYLATRVLRQLGDEEPDLPLGREIIYQEIYMDDVLSGADTEAEALQKQEQLIELLRKGGFVLRKWTSNTPTLLNHLPSHLKATAIDRDCFPSETQAMLGIKWHRDSDTFVIKSIVEELPQIITKRIVLSSIARLFDPLGYAAPILIKSKMFLQSLWLCKLSWDDQLPERIANQWKTRHQELASIHLKISRWIHVSSQVESIEIHGFSDASEKAMSAVVYISIKGDGERKISLLGAKTKVAPLKQVSLPRLELTAAVLLTRLLGKLTTALALPRIDKVCLWTDSTVTLFWIKNHPSRWSTFVGNRVSEIQTSAPEALWSHVPSEDNPADCATRGLSNAELEDHRLWWSGPHWLQLDSEFWPQPPNVTIAESSIEERKPKIVRTYHSSLISDWIEKFSSYRRLLRVTAYCLRFINKSRKLSDQKGSLSVIEILNAKKKLIKEVQSCAFPEEIKALKNKRQIPRSSSLLKFNPILDEDGMLRVGGRLAHSLLRHDQKHPIILPKGHFFSILVIRDAHSRTLHGGTQLTLATIRQEYWILRGRQAVKSVIKECVTCLRFQGTALYQQMGQFPRNRVQPSRPFLHSGVDYAGPILLRTSKGRGQKSYKGYIAVFVCFSTRAIHLEAVSDYTTEGFLAAYRRFTSRRGMCATITSDRGTNFVGASTLLRVLTDPKLSERLTNDQTQWRFNPPAAPHFGGLWEAGVKATKHHLKRVIGDSKPTFEELSTLLCQIEAQLNSRPLQPLSDDPEDLTPLTPAHFLIGQPLTTLPDEAPGLPTNRSLTSRWQLLENQKKSFWNRWSEEYIATLQARNKWEFPNRKIAVGDLVLLKNEIKSPCSWPLGRILKLHAGPDGLVRVVTLRTQNAAEVQRPVVKLCPIVRSQQESKDF